MWQGTRFGFVSAFVLVLAACGSGSHGHPLSEASGQSYRAAPLGIHSRPSAARTTCATQASFSPSPERSYAGVVRLAATAYFRPGVRVLARFGRMDQNGYPTVLGIVGARAAAGCRPTWYRVQLPLPPNGRTGWVPARAIRVYPLATRVVVRLSTRRLVVYRSGRAVFHARVGIGSVQTPTPVGAYFVNERFVLTSPAGPFGVAALGISAHSDVLRDWAQGGPIALHGTDNPASIGRAATHGCIRLLNADMRRLFALVPAGTPVSIRR
jgi:lipoprotein-anchoring transpeptidase ErfK/SrfK